MPSGEKQPCSSTCMLISASSSALAAYSLRYLALCGEATTNVADVPDQLGVNCNVNMCNSYNVITNRFCKCHVHVGILFDVFST